MSLRFTGDFSILEKWERQSRTAPEIVEETSYQLAEETVELIREGFERSSDPHGKKWAKLKLRSGRPLEDTGGLKSSWHIVRRAKSGFVVASAKNYARYHQTGTGIHGPRKERIRPKKKGAISFKAGGKTFALRSVAGAPARRMVPGKKLPARWRNRYRDVYREIAAEHFR